MRWYKRDPDAALAGMIGLTLEERAIYNTVIDVLYSRDGITPMDDRFWSRANECDPRTWRTIRDQLIAKGKLYIESGGQLMARRVRDELESASRRIRVGVELRQKQLKKQRKEEKNTSAATPGQPHPHPHPEREIGGDAPAREAISPEAMSLSNDFLAAIGVDPQNPELHGMAGAPYAAAVWIARGYDRGMVLATAADVAARHGSNKPLHYYGKCFETAHKARAAPAPEREFPLLRTIEGNHETDRRTDWQRRRDAAREAVDEFKAAVHAASVGSSGGS